MRCLAVSTSVSDKCHKLLQLLPFFYLNRQGQISHYNIINICIYLAYIFMTLCLVYIILILVYMDRGSVIWGELEEPGKWGFEEFSKLGKRKRGNLWSGVVWFVGKFWFLSFFFWEEIWDGVLQYYIGFLWIWIWDFYRSCCWLFPLHIFPAHWCWGPSLSLCFSLNVFLYVWTCTKKDIWIGLCCVNQDYYVFFWCIWLLVAVIDFKKKKILDAVLGWRESKTKWKKKKWSPNAYEYMVWLLLFDNVGDLVWSFVLVCCCLENGCD